VDVGDVARGHGRRDIFLYRASAIDPRSWASSIDRYALDD
jgi:hypothetical protein